jgi:hypothetical protein
LETKVKIITQKKPVERQEKAWSHTTRQPSGIYRDARSVFGGKTQLNLWKVLPPNFLRLKIPTSSIVFVITLLALVIFPGPSSFIVIVASFLGVIGRP